MNLLAQFFKELVFLRESSTGDGGHCWIYVELNRSFLCSANDVGVLDADADVVWEPPCQTSGSITFLISGVEPSRDPRFQGCSSTAPACLSHPIPANIAHEYTAPLSWQLHPLHSP